MKTLIAISLSTYIIASVSIFSTSERVEINKDVITTELPVSAYDNAVTIDFSFEEEDYISDIPFNTVDISNESDYMNTIEKDFVIEEEPYINDIPFNTKKIVKKLN